MESTAEDMKVSDFNLIYRDEDVTALSFNG